MLNINLYNLILILMTGKRLTMEEIGFIRGLLRVGYSTTNIIDTFHQSYSRRIGRFTITRIKNPKYTATKKIGLIKNKLKKFLRQYKNSTGYLGNRLK
jgi:hypothetical protein